MPYNYDQFITEYLKEKENSITDDNLRPVFSLFQEKLLLLISRTKLIYQLGGERYCSEETFIKNMTLWFLGYADPLFKFYRHEIIGDKKISNTTFGPISMAFNILSSLLYNRNNFYQKRFSTIAAELVPDVCNKALTWGTGILIRWKELSAEERNKYEISESTKAPSKKQVTWWDQQEKPETTEEAKAAP